MRIITIILFFLCHVSFCQSGGIIFNTPFESMADFDNSADAWRVNIPGNGSTVELVGNAREGSTCLKMVINPDNIRNEIVKQSLFAWGEDYWVGYSIKVIQPVSGYNIITQHRPFPSGPNSLTMRTLDNSTIRMYTSTNDAIKNDMPGNAGTWGGVPQDLNYNIGEWIDIVMNFKLDPDNGYYKVWANGNLVIDINGGTTVYLKDLDGNLKDPLDYAKIGLYYGDDRTSGEIHFDSYKVWEGTGGTYEDVSPGSESPNPGTPTITLSERNAFPSAVGFGKNATGGRGGRIIEVTNLDYRWIEGSLQNAIRQTGPRTIVFKVGGTIDMQGTILFAEDQDLTIAGETAPGGGIMIKNGTLAITTSNVIVRHLRFRGGAINDDGIRIKSFGAAPIENIIVDHCSMSWGEDENMEALFAKNITIQNSIFSEATFGFLSQRGENYSILKNIFALNDQRSIEANTQNHNRFGFEQINNLVFGFNWAVGTEMSTVSTVENNIFRSSDSFVPTANAAVAWSNQNPANDPQGDPEWTYNYVSGNIVGTPGSLPQGQWTTSGGSSVGSAYVKDEPFARSSYIPLATEGLESMLLADTGAGALTSQGIDSQDVSVLAKIVDRTGAVVTSGTFPTIEDGTPYPDSNGDGISDTWATLHGISSASQVKSAYTINGKTIINDAGYTALEIFFAELAGDFERLPLDDGPGPEPQPGKGKGFNRNILLTLD